MEFSIFRTTFVRCCQSITLVYKVDYATMTQEFWEARILPAQWKKTNTTKHGRGIICCYWNKVFKNGASMSLMYLLEILGKPLSVTLPVEWNLFPAVVWIFHPFWMNTTASQTLHWKVMNSHASSSLTNFPSIVSAMASILLAAMLLENWASFITLRLYHLFIFKSSTNGSGAMSSLSFYSLSSSGDFFFLARNSAILKRCSSYNF